MVDYRGFTITPKRDFGTYGFLIKGKYIKRGYVVIKDTCNAMPGATWFMTVEDAKEAIDILIAVGGEDIWKRPAGYSDRFWECITLLRKHRPSIDNVELDL